MKNLAVFVSGTGSLLEAMIADNLTIALVLADRECRGLEIARAAGIPAELVKRTSFGRSFDRRAYTLTVVCVLKCYKIKLVAMAGFMTVLDPVIFQRGYRGRILNTHPALLPAFKGDHAVADALKYGAMISGCTIHIATEELDAGKILAQEAVVVMPGDTKDKLHERIKQAERRLYPLTIRQFMEAIE
ncbi:MAG: phosphoribosylglycinamide formyltransferase [Candidatus Staskawiczbacteria bacterium]|jgi:formyltetrahydrofolate-dependent phosphoribosylglycinamide formyltransferase